MLVKCYTKIYDSLEKPVTSTIIGRSKPNHPKPRRRREACGFGQGAALSGSPLGRGGGWVKKVMWFISSAVLQVLTSRQHDNVLKASGVRLS